MYGTNVCVGIEIDIASSTKLKLASKRASSSGVLPQRLPSQDPCTDFVHDASLLNDWLHSPVGDLQSHQSLRFCAYRLVADREDTNADHVIGAPWQIRMQLTITLESTDVQPTQPAIFYLKLRATESKTNRCADWEQAVNAPRWLMLTLVTTRWSR
ncbi:hypothetical protein T07_4908 [Trichinella nelsoni]|uniref:Uncharacterized protein n=1 Tax=Trichinella nelsoni TaxID=6336 RepID=A0A0V0RDB1_9BILA|nr:hypothetical protein T07_4908 [Trichinella nelsoni]